MTTNPLHAFVIIECVKKIKNVEETFFKIICYSGRNYDEINKITHKQCNLQYSDFKAITIDRFSDYFQIIADADDFSDILFIRDIEEHYDYLLNIVGHKVIELLKEKSSWNRTVEDAVFSIDEYDSGLIISSDSEIILGEYTENLDIERFSFLERIKIIEKGKPSSGKFEGESKILNRRSISNIKENPVIGIKLGRYETYFRTVRSYIKIEPTFIGFENMKPIIGIDLDKIIKIKNHNRYDPNDFNDFHRCIVSKYMHLKYTMPYISIVLISSNKYIARRTFKEVNKYNLPFDVKWLKD